MGDSYGPPAVPAAIVNDLSQWYASVEKLRGIAEQSNANVIFGHDAEQLWSLGDMVGRGPDPEHVVARTRERCSVALLGNHDYGATGSAEARTRTVTCRPATSSFSGASISR